MGIAPLRASRGGDAVQSMTVEGKPSGEPAPGTTISTRSTSRESSPPLSDGASSPDKFALVPVIGPPNRRSSSSVTG